MVEPLANVLIVDDEVNIRNALVRILERQGLTAAAASTGTEVLSALQEEQYQVVVTDLKMIGLDGLGLLREIKKKWPEVEVIIMTAYATVESAVEAMKEGAYDYLIKPIDYHRFPVLVGKALEKQRLGAENRELRHRLHAREEFEYVVGKSLAMQQIHDLVDQIAPTEATVLLQGESGTGKEIIARVIHEKSDRADGPFIAINCGALPETLLESELFGYEKGAFTGASQTKKGRIELADGGTLFLDEVGEMSPKSQVDLLRVLQEKEFCRLGGTRPICVEIRIIAASNKDLTQKVKEGAFREDLYYRLNVVPITLPPLRERREDIPLLIEAFLLEFAKRYRQERKKLSRAAQRLLLQYPWPGNVRELRNLIERLVVTVPEKMITPEHLPLREAGEVSRTLTLPLGVTLKEIEREVIRHTLTEIASHRERAAEILGISPRALHYKIKEYGLLE